MAKGALGQPSVAPQAAPRWRWGGTCSSGQTRCLARSLDGGGGCWHAVGHASCPGRVLSGGGGGGWSGAKKSVYQKWPDKSFPTVNFVFSNDGPFGPGGGGEPPPPRVTCRRVVVSLRGPGHSPALPSACCVGSLRSVGRCGRCSLLVSFLRSRSPVVGVPGLC